MEVADAAFGKLPLRIVLRELGKNLFHPLAKGRIGRRLVGHHFEDASQGLLDHISPTRSRNSPANLRMTLAASPYFWSIVRLRSDHSAARAICSACGINVVNTLNWSLSIAASLWCSE